MSQQTIWRRILLSLPSRLSSSCRRRRKRRCERQDSDTGAPHVFPLDKLLYRIFHLFSRVIKIIVQILGSTFVLQLSASSFWLQRSKSGLPFGGGGGGSGGGGINTTDTLIYTDAWNRYAPTRGTDIPSSRCCRAKYVIGSVAQLRAKPGGGTAWLQGLRDVPYQMASEALCTLPGVGPKVCCLS